MRKNLKIPRILKINWVKDLSISVVFNNGESRIIDFPGLLKSLNLMDSPANMLLEPEAISQVKLVDNILSWNNIGQYNNAERWRKKESPFRNRC